MTGYEKQPVERCRDEYMAVWSYEWDRDDTYFVSTFTYAAFLSVPSELRWLNSGAHFCLSHPALSVLLSIQQMVSKMHKIQS